MRICKEVRLNVGGVTKECRIEIEDEGLTSGSRGVADAITAINQLMDKELEDSDKDFPPRVAQKA